MSIGGNQPPFRLPCGAVEGVKTSLLGFPCRTLAAASDAYHNTTQMLDHCGNTITAKERKYVLDVCGDAICTTGCSDCPGGFDLITNTPEPPTVSGNTWSHVGSVPLDIARKIGVKLVQAFKAWHGDFGFTFFSDGTSCTGGAKSNTKYRTKRMYASLTDSGGNVWTRLRTVSLNIYGVATLPECDDTGDPSSEWPAVLKTDLESSPRCSDDVPSVLTYLGECDAGTVTTGPTGSYGYILDSGSGVKTLEVVSTRSDPTYSWTVTQRTIANTVIGLYTGSIALSDAYTTNDVLADAAALVNQWRLTDDAKYPFRTDRNTTVGPAVVFNEAPAATPSIVTKCTSDDLTSPIDDSFGNHPFDPSWLPTYDQRAWFDPNAYAWKYNPPANMTEAAANVLTLLYDGSVIGAPLAAGYGWQAGPPPVHDGVFDKDHENWFRKNCDPGIGWTQEPISRGGYTPEYLPANAQAWTNDFTATTLWPCAFINADVNGVYLQKWCETKVKRPSIDFARPYGAEKFALDETAVYYVSDFTAGVVTLKDLDFHTVTSLPFTTADIVGSAAVDGFFIVASVGANTVTLGSKVYDLPAGWTTPSRDGAACFGKLKYTQAPGMDFTDSGPEVGGRVRVTVADGSPVTITTSTVQKYLSITTPEYIDILAADMTVLASPVAATRVDDTHFTVPTAFVDIAAAAWIVPYRLNDGSTSGQKYKFADSRSKGDYVYRTWKIRISDATVLATSQQDECLPFNACAGPAIAGITPNGETAANAHFFAFPASVNNGELWLGQIQFWMPDPFWQQPHKPVAANVNGVDDPSFNPDVDLIVWVEDDGSCIADSTSVGGGGETIYRLVYPMRPYVEARCTLPTNIGGETPPAIASGADLTTVQGPPPQASIGNAEGPLVDAIIIQIPAWVKMLTQRGCVDSVGRFASDYEANGTTP